MNIALRPATSQALAVFRDRRSRLLRWRSTLALLFIALTALCLLALLDRFRLVPDTLRPWLTLAIYAGAALAAWIQVKKDLRAARADADAARLIEAASPVMHERLLAAVELAETGDSPNVPDSPEFRARLQDEVAADVQKLRWSELLPVSMLAPWFRRLGMLALLIAACAVTPRLHFPGFLARAALPFAPLERPASVKIHIVSPDPADTLAAFVSEVEVAADVIGDLGNHRVVIEFKEANAPARKIEMALLQGSRFEQSLPHLLAKANHRR